MRSACLFLQHICNECAFLFAVWAIHHPKSRLTWGLMFLLWNPFVVFLIFLHDKLKLDVLPYYEQHFFEKPGSKVYHLISAAIPSSSGPGYPIEHQSTKCQSLSKASWQPWGGRNSVKKPTKSSCFFLGGNVQPTFKLLGITYLVRKKRFQTFISWSFGWVRKC